MVDQEYKNFEIKRFSYASDLFCLLLRVVILGVSLLMLVNFLITDNTANLIGSVVGGVVSLYLFFGDYLNSLKVINKKIFIKSAIDSYEVEIDKIKSVSIIGVSQKNGTKDFLFEFLDEEGELTKAKVKSVISAKKLEEFLEQNKIKISNAMKRGVNMKPVKIIVGIALVAVLIFVVMYSVRLWGASEDPEGNTNAGSDLLNPTGNLEEDAAQIEKATGTFPLPKASIEETGFKVDDVHLNSRKIFAFSSNDKKMYSFAYVFPANVKKTDLFICFDLDCNLYSVFHIDKSKMLEEPVTFEAGSNSPLNNFQLQTSIIEVMGLVMLSFSHDSFDSELFPVLKVAVSELDNRNSEQFTAYDFTQ